MSDLGGWARENALKTHCNNGHPFEGSNLKLRRRAEGYVERVCVACYRADKRAAYARRTQIRCRQRQAVRA